MKYRHLQSLISNLLFLMGLMLFPVNAAGQTADSLFISAADYDFGQMMRFHLRPKNGDGVLFGSVRTVTLLFRAPEFPNTFTVAIPTEPGSELDVAYVVDLTEVRLAPFTHVTFWWVLTMADEEDIVVPEQVIVYEDDRFNWRELTQNGVTAHWVGEDTALGQLALDIVQEALPHLQGVVETPAAAAPLTLYIYPAAADLRAALRLTGRDWVGAHVDPALGIILVTAVNPRTAATDLRQSIPHELVHFWLFQAVGPTNEQRLPAWFDEGLATYMERLSNPGYEAILATAVAEQATIPFNQLCHTFPAAEEQARLAYAQSVSFLTFIQATYGDQALSNLTNAFIDGADCQSGVRRALQLSLAELNAAWLREQQPRSPIAQFFRDNSLWLLFFVAGFGLMGLLILRPGD